MKSFCATVMWVCITGTVVCGAEVPLTSGSPAKQKVEAGFTAKSKPKIKTESTIKGKNTVKKIGPIDTGPAGKPWNGAYTLETEYYVIHIDLPEEKGREAAKHMEYQLHAMAEMLDFDLNAWAEEKPQCYLFQDLEKFEKVRDAMKGPESAIHGYVRNNTLYCYAQGRGYGGLYLSYLHGSAQLALGALTGRTLAKKKHNVWVVEGIACYLGSMRINEDKPSFGRENHNILKEVIQEFGKHTAKMVTWGHAEFYNRDQGAYYMLGYTACRYLMRPGGAKDGKSLGTYIKLVYNDTDKKNSFEQVLGMTPARLQEYVIAQARRMR